MYNFVFWLLFGAAAVFTIVDIAKARNDDDWKENTLWHLGEILALLVIAIVTTLFALFANRHGLSNDEAAILISLTVLLMPVRKIVDVIIYGLNSYLIATDNNYAAKMDQRLLITNPKTGKKEFSIGVLRLYHTAVFFVFLLIYLFCSAFPRLALFRFNVTLNVWTNLIAKFTGNNIDRVVLMIWMLTLIVFIVMIFMYVRIVYKNYIHWWTDGASKRGGDARSLRYKIIIFMALRKFFMYLFVMTNYRFKDFVFWWVIFVIVTAISFAFWYRARRKGRTSQNIW